MPYPCFECRGDRIEMYVCSYPYIEGMARQPRIPGARVSPIATLVCPADRPKLAVRPSVPGFWRRTGLRCSLLATLAAACEMPTPPALIDRESDREFDGGSRIERQPLSPIQIENLALLGEVWGFVKSHHPGVAGGQRNWDYELFRAMPAVLRARDRPAAAAVISAWLGKLGDPEPCRPCAPPPTSVYLLPDIEWIHDTGRLGAELSSRLGIIHERRPTSQFYADRGFSVEARYDGTPLPDAGFRLLSLFRYWNIIQYWSPYRDVMEQDWRAVLREFIPRLMAASTEDDYALEMTLVTARINDTHAYLSSHLHLRPPRGTFEVAVGVRFIEGRAVVARFTHPTLGPATGLEIGDVIETLDGRSVESLIAEWQPYYGASNEAARRRDIARFLTRGEGPTVILTGTRDGVPFQRTVERVPAGYNFQAARPTHDLPGPVFQMLSDEVATSNSPRSGRGVPPSTSEWRRERRSLCEGRRRPHQVPAQRVDDELRDSTGPL
jgi:hypothetical protein